MAASWRELLAIASRLEPRMAAAYLDAIRRIRARTDADAIARAISEDRRYVPAANLPLFEQALEPALAIVHDAIQQAGNLAAARIKDDLGVAMRFDMTNPLAVQVARETAAGMVTNISAETRLALQNVIRRSIEEGITYSDVAAIIRSMVGLTQAASQAVLNYRLGLIDLGLNRALVQKRVRAYAEKKLRERALTIARSEIMAATNAGQIAAWRQAQRRGLLRDDTEMEFIVTPDDRLCDQCLAMEGERVPVGQSFPGGNPPIHPRCRCAAVLVIKDV